MAFELGVGNIVTGRALAKGDCKPCFDCKAILDGEVVKLCVKTARLIARGQMSADAANAGKENATREREVEMEMSESQKARERMINRMTKRTVNGDEAGIHEEAGMAQDQDELIADAVDRLVMGRGETPGGECDSEAARQRMIDRMKMNSRRGGAHE